MDKFACRVWNDASPVNKPRVYFTCYTGDFISTFDIICRDLFRTLHCAVYYLSDPDMRLTEEEQENDLMSMQLFVIPVTWNLLSQPCRTLEEELPFAIRNGIPVLPIMMEPGLDEIYRREDRFQNLHYLSPDQRQNTGLSYEEKLERFLKSVFPKNDYEGRVREAFDATIFLSYRRQDRRKARQVMQAIHRIPELTSVAIWYDDYLPLGSDFKDQLHQKVAGCDLMAIVVSPTLVADRDNYVLSVEYPDAVKLKKPVLGIEVEKTEKDILREYPPLDECIHLENEEELKKNILVHLNGLSVGEKAEDPLHCFFMGYAYLFGIDVELNRKRAVSLLTYAAEADEPNAQRQLSDMYATGLAVELDYAKALYWAKQEADTCIRIFGENAQETWSAHFQLALCYQAAGDSESELNVWREMERCGKDRLTEEELIRIRINCASALSSLNRNEEALEMFRAVAERFSDTDTKENRNALMTLANMAYVLSELGELDKALELSSEVLPKIQAMEGKNARLTLFFLNNHACYLIEHRRLYEAEEMLCDLRARCEENLGPRDTLTMDTIHNLAWCARENEDWETALAYEKEAYTLRAETLGVDHPTTLYSLGTMMKAYAKWSGERNKELPFLTDIAKKMLSVTQARYRDARSQRAYAMIELASVLGRYEAYETVLLLVMASYAILKENEGEKSPRTLNALRMKGYCLGCMGKWIEAVQELKNCRDLTRTALGETHEVTVETTENLGSAYHFAGQHEKALQTLQELYPNCCKAFGEEDRRTLCIAFNIANTLLELERNTEALEQLQSLEPLFIRAYGEKSEETFRMESSMINALRLNGEIVEAVRKCEKVLPDMMKTLGSRHGIVLLTLRQKAQCLSEMGDHDEACAVMEEVCKGYLETLSMQDSETVRALYIKAKIQSESASDQRRALETVEEAYVAAMEVCGLSDELTCNCLSLMKTLRRELWGIELMENDGVIRTVERLKRILHYERLLTGNIADSREVQKAMQSYAQGADLSGGAAIEETGRGFLGLTGSRGILFTEAAVYQDSLPRGIPYEEIRRVMLQEDRVKLTLFDGEEHEFEPGASAPEIVTMLRTIISM